MNTTCSASQSFVSLLSSWWMYQTHGIIRDIKWNICTQFSRCKLIKFFEIDLKSMMCFMGSVCGVMKCNHIWYITLSHDVRFGQCVPHHHIAILMRVSSSALILSSSLGKVLIMASKNLWRGNIYVVSWNFGNFSQQTSFETW